MSQQVLEIARKSMMDNKKLLDSLGSEKSVTSLHHPEEDTVSKLLALLPNSSIDKNALIGAVALIVFELLTSRKD